MTGWLTKAFRLRYLSHKDVKRASGEPYYYHPLSVAKIVASEINIDDVSVVAALLHDTVEDTAVTLEDIEQGVRGRWFTSSTVSPRFRARSRAAIPSRPRAFMKLLAAVHWQKYPRRGAHQVCRPAPQHADNPALAPR
ncbi:MAG: HD domain-containing protein [Balneolaceae bacterium]|nr:HD domain-containing protein [Balneolaceae bacterium]